MFHTTHHIQKRDLLWGCYTKVSISKNPLWTKKIVSKKQVCLDLLIMIVLIYNFSSLFDTKTNILLGLLWMRLCPVDRFIIEPERDEFRMRQYKFKYMTRLYYQYKYRIFYTQDNFTTYKSNFVTAAPLLIFFVGHDRLKYFFFN